MHCSRAPCMKKRSTRPSCRLRTWKGRRWSQFEGSMRRKVRFGSTWGHCRCQWWCWLSVGAYPNRLELRTHRLRQTQETSSRSSPPRPALSCQQALSARASFKSASKFLGARRRFFEQSCTTVGSARHVESNAWSVVLAGTTMRVCVVGVVIHCKAPRRTHDARSNILTSFMGDMSKGISFRDHFRITWGTVR